jgi:putative flippase GtrA
VPPRLPHIFVEIGRFMVSGGLATLSSFLVFNFLVHGLWLTSDPWMATHPITAFIIASLVGMVVSYRLSRYWTFRHRPPVHPDGGRTMFFLINLVTLPLAVGTLWFSRHVLGLDDPLSDNLAGNVIGALLGQVARFYLFRRYVFQQPVHAGDLAHQPVSLLGPAHQLLDPERAGETAARTSSGDSTGRSSHGRGRPPAGGAGAG